MSNAEDGLVGNGAAVRVEARNVLLRDDAVNAGAPRRPCSCRREDAGVGVLRPDDLALEHSLHRHVVCVGELALHALRCRRASTDDVPIGPYFGSHSSYASSSSSHSAAFATASKIGMKPVQRQMLSFSPSRISSWVGCGLLVEQRLRRHDHPGDAEPALDRAAVEERRLDRVERAVGLREAVDRLDRRPVGAPHQVDARVDRLAVDEDGAGAAVAARAAVLRAHQAEVVAQVPQQRLLPVDPRGDRVAVQRERRPRPPSPAISPLRDASPCVLLVQ